MFVVVGIDAGDETYLAKISVSFILRMLQQWVLRPHSTAT